MKNLDLRASAAYVSYTNLMNKSLALFAESIGLSHDQVFLTCGATGGLDAVFGVLPPNSKIAIMPFEYFDIHELASIHHHAIRQLRSSGTANSIDDFCAFIRKEKPDAVYLSMPNNPLGQTYGTSDIKKLFASVRSDTLCIFDQTLLSKARISVSWFQRNARGKTVAIVRSFSKSHRAVGGRIGYVAIPCKVFSHHIYAHAPAAASLSRLKRYLSSGTIQEETLGQISANSDFIRRWIRDYSGVTWSNSGTDFGALHFSTLSAVALAVDLKKHGMLVKTHADLFCSGNFLRLPLTVPSLQLQRFLSKLGSIISGQECPHFVVPAFRG